MEKITLLVAVAGITAFGFIPQKNAAKTTKDSVYVQAASAVKAPLPPPPAPVIPQRPMAPVLMKDTVVPGPLSFKNVSSYNNDDGTTKTSEVKALGSDGKKYTYKLVNEEIREFAIDGISVGKANFHKYDWIVAAVDGRRNESINNALERQKINLDILETKELQLQRDQAERLNLVQKINLEGKNEQLLKTLTDSTLSLPKMESLELQKINLQLLENKLQLDRPELVNEKLSLLKADQWKLQEPIQLSALQQISPPVPNDDIKDIVGMLLDSGIITDRDNVSFRLDNDELVVNGKKQPGNIFLKLKARFIKGKKDHYIYKTDGHGTSTDISKE